MDLDRTDDRTDELQDDDLDRAQGQYRLPVSLFCRRDGD